MANVNFLPDDQQNDGGGMTRREAIGDGAKLVIAAGIGAQIMAATGADTAVAKQVRSIAGRAANKPGYGKLVSTMNGKMQLPKGFEVFQFGIADTPMSDGLKTPRCHDGSAVFKDKQGRLTLIRNQELAGLGHSIGPKGAYDRNAKGGVTATTLDPKTGKVLGSALVLNGTDNNCNGGRTPWGTWLTCEESTVGKYKGY